MLCLDKSIVPTRQVYLMEYKCMYDYDGAIYKIL